MSPRPNQTDLSTDAYLMNQPATTSAKSGLNINQKKALGISAATLLLGGAALAISHKISERTNQTSDTEAPATESAVTTSSLPDDIDVAGKVTDSMSFEQAFAAARDEVGMGGVFNWHGHWYNTFEKEEWSGLSLQQRQEYTEQITGEKLPVKPYTPPVAHTTGTTPAPIDETEPTIIEGYLNGQRVMGLDFDQDGIIDTLVLDGADGNTYRVVDATGNDGLDTLYRYDSLDGELTGAVRLDQPFILSNDDFSQELENAMSKEVVDSILESEDSVDTPAIPADEDTADEADDNGPVYLANAYEADDDTYVNNGDVHDMDE
jgi:hypothetical protein